MKRIQQTPFHSVQLAFVLSGVIQPQFRAPKHDARNVLLGKEMTCKQFELHSQELHHKTHV
jgi:hypothetical protein